GIHAARIGAVGVGAVGVSAAGPAADGGTGSVVWPARLAKVRILRMSKGTGWAIGATGVLTARRVIEPLLATDPDAQAPRAPVPRSAEIVIGASPERSFDGEVIWQSEASGLAILNVSRNTATWQTLL